MPSCGMGHNDQAYKEYGGVGTRGLVKMNNACLMMKLGCS